MSKCLPGAYWSKRIKPFTIPSPDFRRDGTTKHFDINYGWWARGKHKEAMDGAYEKILPRIEYCTKVFDTGIGHPPRIALMSMTSLHFSLPLEELYLRVPEVRTIVEIGGGFGGLARQFLAEFPSAEITLVDFPEMLELQSWYLSQHGYFLPASFLPAGHDFPARYDAAVNMTSMCEMDIDQAVFYRKQLERTLRPGAPFISVNHEYCVGASRRQWGFDDSPHWEIVRDEPFPHLPDKRGQFMVWLRK